MRESYEARNVVGVKEEMIRRLALYSVKEGRSIHHKEEKFRIPQIDMTYEIFKSGDFVTFEFAVPQGHEGEVEWVRRLLEESGFGRVE